MICAGFLDPASRQRDIAFITDLEIARQLVLAKGDDTDLVAVSHQAINDIVRHDDTSDHGAEIMWLDPRSGSTASSAVPIDDGCIRYWPCHCHFLALTRQHGVSTG